MIAELAARGPFPAEVRAFGRYAYVIINDDIDRASRALAAVIGSRRQRLERQEAEIAKVLRDFPPASDTT